MKENRYGDDDDDDEKKLKFTIKKNQDSVE